MTPDDVSKLRSRMTLMARRLRKEAMNDAVSWSKMLIVGLIDRMGGSVTPTMLATAEGMSSANVAALLRELEAVGLIDRTPDPDDKRKTWISLSPKGQRALRESRQARETWLRAAMEATLSPAEQEQLLAASESLERLALFYESSRG
ncbi:MarR family winged helix-turn-helix transcriptional regulator [Rhizobium sp. GR12]|uniref:MarR family winged helix-turn-helix transcriptional regulator n=1 Tax=Rhizobium sp. GR12 TaxID=3053925 RepID=UPI002FBE451E